MASRGRPRHPDILTPREWEVLELLRQGLSNGQIAERLGTTERTAKFHVSEILSKLGLSGREEAAVWQPGERKPWWMAALPLSLKWSTVGKIAGASLLAATAGGIAVLAWGVLNTESHDKEEVQLISQNRQILDGLPDMPGSQRLKVEDNPYYTDNDAITTPIGWTLNVDYSVPANLTDEDVIDFFSQNMGDDWQPHVEEIPVIAPVPRGEAAPTPQGRVLHLIFTRGEAMVNVGMEQMFPSGHGFNIAIDAHGAK